MSGAPFGVVASADGRWGFVVLPYEVEVISLTATPHEVVQTVALPATVSAAAGAAITPDGHTLLVAAGSGAVVLDVAAAERNPSKAVLGTLASGSGSDAIEVSTSRDGHYAFVSREYANEIVVFDLRKARDDHFSASALVGKVAVGRTVVGSALSRDGTKLYVTSEGGGTAGGLLSVLDVNRLETEPSKAVTVSIAAGCDPVRVQPSPDGRTVWVTARESNTVLAFDAARLVTDPAHARVAAVRVGSAPVGLVFFRNGQRLLVTQSGRFSNSPAPGSLAVIDPVAALAGKPALLGVVRAGVFPRDTFLAQPSNMILVSNYGSKQVQTIDAGTLP